MDIRQSRQERTKLTESPPFTTSMETTKSPRYEHAIQILGKRWTGLLLDTLMLGPHRFCELTSMVEGLSGRILSDRLRKLEAEGLVTRMVYPQIPVRVEYQLSEKGYALKPVIDAIHAWAERWIDLQDLSDLPAPLSQKDTAGEPPRMCR